MSWDGKLMVSCGDHADPAVRLWDGTMDEHVDIEKIQQQVREQRCMICQFSRAMAILLPGKLA